ncbi:hypothetical protein ACFLUY_03655 [Chloroflexota bacterium]
MIQQLAFSAAAVIVADDIPTGGVGILDDPLAAVAVLVGVGIIVGANWDYIEDKVSDALDVAISLSSKLKQGRKSTWDKHTKRRSGAPEKGDKRRTPRKPPKR